MSMEEQRKKLVNSSPLTSADQLDDVTHDSSVNEVIYEEEECVESSSEEEHGPTTSESEPLDLKHRKINPMRGKHSTLSADVLSQFIVRIACDLSLVICSTNVI